MITVRSYTRRRPSRPSVFIETTEQLLADLWLERELRAWEAAEYALSVLEKDIGEALLSELDKIDMPDEQKRRIRESM